MIRVLLVDDSPIALHILKNLLLRAKDIEVVGTASDGKNALAQLSKINPDVICTDLHMPGMDGLELTRVVMATQPRPILVISVSVQPGSTNVFSLLEAGAVDVFLKPRAILGADQDKLAMGLASKIRIVAGVHVFRYKPQLSYQATPKSIKLSESQQLSPVKIITIGASTGGPQALHTIFCALPASFPIPIVCVQHIGADFLTELIRWLSDASRLPIRKATHGELPKAGIIYFSPANCHLEFDAFGRFALSDAPPCDGHRPSVTVLMRSAAHHYKASTIGVLLTGMGRDGATGLAEIASVGGLTIAQNEESSIVYGMPQAAVALGAVRHELALEQIAPALTAFSKNTYATNDESKSEEAK